MTMRQRKRRYGHAPRRWHIRQPYPASVVCTAHEMLAVRRDPGLIWSVYR